MKARRLADGDGGTLLLLRLLNFLENSFAGIMP